MSDTQKDQPVPGHINPVTGRFCTREGQLAPGGQCPEGCDHADHYSNDGHPECADDPLALAETIARLRTRDDHTQKD